jgi:hypothetical protein
VPLADDPTSRIRNGEINPGKVFDLDLPVQKAADAYLAMDERRVIRALLRS